MMDIAARLARRMEGRMMLIIGRASMDLYPIPDGSSIEQAAMLAPDLGGSAGNIAVALARLGCSSALMTALSDDAVGRFVDNRLRYYGVDMTYCYRTSGLERTSLALAETRMPDASVVIYRNNAADLSIHERQVEELVMTDISALIVTGTALSREPSRHAVTCVVDRARAMGCPVVFDIDYRSQAWAKEEEARQIMAMMSKRVDMIAGNEEEFDLLDPGGGRDFAEELTDRGALVLYKMGELGCDMLDKTNCEHIDAFPVQALKPFGAGDAFLGGVLAILATGANLARAGRFGAAAAALVVSKRGCASAMPDKAEVQEFLDKQYDSEAEAEPEPEPETELETESTPEPDMNRTQENNDAYSAP